MSEYLRWAEKERRRRGLPPRGTGLRTGRAGERRFGHPRTDIERKIRHRGGIERTITIIEEPKPADIVTIEYEGHTTVLRRSATIEKLLNRLKEIEEYYFPR